MNPYNVIEGRWKYDWAWFVMLGCCLLLLLGLFQLLASSMLWMSMIVMICTMLLYMYYKYSNDQVSNPGGPRPHKIMRSPQWNHNNNNNNDEKKKKVFNLFHSNKNWNSFKCVVATESHMESLKQYNLPFNNGHGENGIRTQSIGLSGEPAGRQTWISTTTSTSTTDDGGLSEKHLQLANEWCRGGRATDEFSPWDNPNSGDFVFRRQQILKFLQQNPNFTPDNNNNNNSSSSQDVKTSLKKAVTFYEMLQTDDGHWAGDYGGPHFLMPGMIIAWYIMERSDQILSLWQRQAIAYYLVVHQQSDGGWGSHIESPSTMFGTVLSYVALRLLWHHDDNNNNNTTQQQQQQQQQQEEEARNEILQQAKKFIHSQEHAALSTSSWAKFWLCLLGVMEWEGHNSVPPEMWLLPNWFPFHPGRLWCHCRMVYLPMGYLYGNRFVYPKADTDPVIQQLRQELYTTPYSQIPWNATRHIICPLDNYSPIPFVMKTLQNILAVYEKYFVPTFLRNKGLQFSIKYMEAEDLQTNFIDIGPVNKVLNMISMYHSSGCSLTNSKVINHILRVPDYLWIAEDGMKMQGYNGSSCWDTSFAIQAISEAQLLDDFPNLCTKVWSYLEKSQILSTPTSQASLAYQYEEEENRIKSYRHVSKGGWPFSSSAHGWPISDCTGEGLKGVLVLMQNAKCIQKGLSDQTIANISDERLFDAANVLLTYQNVDGGWATYENNRGFGWYEQLNPSEVFGDIMIDYSYVECSMASMTGLAMFHDMFPDHRTEEIKSALQRGRSFLKRIQRPDGSWYGSWACCFCYGCWFGIEGLMLAGESKTSPAITKCVEFLVKHQRSNGGWGEDFTSCYDKDYAKDGMVAYGDECGSGVVNTAWALMALSQAECADIDVIRRGVHYLMERQLSSGDWPQEGISGVFNRSIGITYTAYRNVFPIWALGRCMEKYGCDVLNGPTQTS